MNSLYLIQKTDTFYRYAPIHLKNGYQYTPELNCSETVTIHGFYDSIGIQLILERMRELNRQNI